MIDGDVEPDNRPVAPADDGCLGNRQKIHEPEHVGRHKVIAERLAIARAAPMATAVHDNDLVALGQHRHQIAPIVRVGEPAV